jgi:hypothetical protein
MFARTVIHDSTTTPGVSFEVRRMGLGTRTDLDFETLAHRQRLRELESDYPVPCGKEAELSAQLEIAKRKSLAVPADQFEAVLEADVKPLALELQAAIPIDVRKKRAVIDEEYAQVDARLRAAWIRSGLIAINGGELDGMNAEELLDYGPRALAQEIYLLLVNDGRLRGGEIPNLGPPITSGEAVGGDSQNSTAGSAGVLQVVGTLNEIVSSTFRPT